MMMPMLRVIPPRPPTILHYFGMTIQLYFGIHRYPQVQPSPLAKLAVLVEEEHVKHLMLQPQICINRLQAKKQLMFDETERLRQARKPYFIIYYLFHNPTSFLFPVQTAERELAHLRRAEEAARCRYFN